MSYEWEYGSASYSGSTVNQTISAALKALFESYQDGLALSGSHHTSAHSTTTYPYGSTTSYANLTYANLDDYILNQYLIPSAEMYLASLSSSARTTYLKNHSWITYTASTGKASFTFAKYVSAIGRGKSVPAFDSFYGYSSSLSGVNTSETAEVNEFGTSGGYRHFTNFSSEETGGSAITTSVQTLVNMMNPMYFIMKGISNNSTSGVANSWYIRDGSTATDTSAMVIVDLATSLENLMAANSTSWNVNAWENWEKGHNVNADPWDLITWVKKVK